MDLEKMDLVGVTHIEDAITFWALNVSEDQAIKEMNSTLAQICPISPRLSGNPCPQKIYAALFSEDNCWYRCKVQQQADEGFHVSFIDYGNKDIISRSCLVEIPQHLQSLHLAKKYKFWGFHVSSDPNSSHFNQGKTFLQNMMCGKKVRIQKKSVCSDGTILVQAFQGNLNIGEELLKMTFAKPNLSGTSGESPKSLQCLQDPSSLWAPQMLIEGGQGELDYSTACMPKLRPVFTDMRPLSVREKSTSSVSLPTNVVKEKMDQNVIEVNTTLKAKVDAQHQMYHLREKEVGDAHIELQELERVNNFREAECIQQLIDCVEAEQLQIQDTGLKGEMENENEMNPLLDLPVGAQFCRLAEKVESLRGLREKIPGIGHGDILIESIGTVINNSITAPIVMGKLEKAWTEYSLAQNKLKACQTKEEVSDLIKQRDELLRIVLAQVDSFLKEVNDLPVRQRIETLEKLSTSLSSVFGPLTDADMGEQSYEEYYQWRTQHHQNLSCFRDATDKALSALCNWSTNVSKFFCLTSKTTVSLKNIVDEINDILKQTELTVTEELNFCRSDGNNQENHVVTNAFQQVMQHIHKEKSVLSDIMEKCLFNTKFKNEMQQWQKGPPTPATLLSIKKRVRILRSQLKWRQVEQCSLEEEEELDLSEILKKKEEIAETRKVLFQEIGKEKEEYKKLRALVDEGFPELPLMYPEADIHGFMRTGGLLVRSLDRDLFDAKPMKELSGRRPLVCTDFQGQRVILKSYTVNEETEELVLQRTTQFHCARTQSKSDAILPLLALFLGKSDPLAYVMVPYFPNGSLKAVQAVSPLTTTEVTKAMKGVGKGLQVLHAAGIIHASLNPNNVFVLNRERGLVGDFDFANTPEKRAERGDMMAGTICLVAPELRNGLATPSPACDIFSFGGLILWLHVSEFTGLLDDLDGLKLESKLQALLHRLLVLEDRPTAAQLLADDYFLTEKAE